MRLIARMCRRVEIGRPPPDPPQERRQCGRVAKRPDPIEHRQFCVAQGSVDRAVTDRMKRNGFAAPHATRDDMVPFDPRAQRAAT